MAEELAELKKATNRSRMLILGAVVGVVVLAGIFAFGGSSDVTEFSLGSPCKNDCGRFDLDGWICLSDAKYCTYPCGGIHRSCPKEPEAFECKEVPGAIAQSEVEGSDEKKALYCLKK